MVIKYVSMYHEKEKLPISLYSKIYSTTSDDFKSENVRTIKR